MSEDQWHASAQASIDQCYGSRSKDHYGASNDKDVAAVNATAVNNSSDSERNEH